MIIENKSEHFWKTHLPLLKQQYSTVVTNNIKCGFCNKSLRNGILCDVCDEWNHFRCVVITKLQISYKNI